MCAQQHWLRRAPPSSPFATGNEGLYGERRMLQQKQTSEQDIIDSNQRTK
jgi:hypothetical protein